MKECTAKNSVKGSEQKRGPVVRTIGSSSRQGGRILGRPCVLGGHWFPPCVCVPGAHTCGTATGCNQEECDRASR